MRIPLFLLLVLISGGLLHRETGREPFRSMEESFAAWLSTNSGRPPTPAPTVMVEIGEEELTRQEWPWSPLDYALYANAATAFQSRVVAFEPLLSWENPDANHLSLLRTRLLRAPQVLFGGQLGFVDGTHPPLPEGIAVLRQVFGNTGKLRDFTQVILQPDPALRDAGQIGFENLFLGRTGSLRRMPLVFRYCGEVIPSFALRGAMLWYGVTPEEVTVTPGVSITLGSEVTIPINEAGEMLIRLGTPLTRFSYDDLLLAAEEIGQGRKPAVPIDRLKDSFTLLTRTDRMAPRLEFGGREGSRGELFALAVATIQNKEFAQPAPGWVTPLLMVAALAVAALLARATAFGALTISIVGIGTYLLVALSCFSATLLVLPLVVPVGMILIALGLRYIAGINR